MLRTKSVNISKSTLSNTSIFSSRLKFYKNSQLFVNKSILLNNSFNFVRNAASDTSNPSITRTEVPKPETQNEKLERAFKVASSVASFPDLNDSTTNKKSDEVQDNFNIGLNSNSNLFTQQKSSALSKARTQFWKNATVKQEKNGCTIQLSGRPLKTPSKTLILIPKSKPTLAHLITLEWANLSSLKVKQHDMLLTGLTSRAIDLQSGSPNETSSSSNSSSESNQPSLTGLSESDSMNRVAVTEHLLRYLETDTMLVFNPREEYKGKLRKAQEEVYRPIISWVEESIFNQKDSNGETIRLKWLDTEYGLLCESQNDAIVNAAREWVNKLDPWKFVAFERAVYTAKSFIAGILIIEQRMSSRKVAEAVSLETEYQVEKWGEVEDTHDVEWADIRRRLGSCAIIATDEDLN